MTDTTTTRERRATDTGTAPMIDVRALDVAFGSTTVLHGVDLRLERGRTVGVVGESGSGKSTLAKVLVGTVKPASGSATVDGVDLAAADERPCAATGAGSR